MQDKLILFVDSNFYSKLELWENLGDEFTIHTLTNGMEAYKWLLEGNKPDIIISEFYLPGYSGLNLLSGIRNNPSLKEIPFIFICDHNFEANILKARELGANDIYLRPLNYSRLRLRINTLIRLKDQKIKTISKESMAKIDFKSVVESSLAFLMIVLLSPFFLIIAAIIKLDSPGPVFQVSSKIGKGYKRMKEYKFRSSKWNKKPEFLVDHSNSRPTLVVECPECLKSGRYCSPMLYLDGMSICESHYKRLKGNSFFREISSESELTTFGRILKKTKIDSLPNLINVMKGNISLIGEEALLPEVAEKYTNDKDSRKLLVEVGLFKPKFIQPGELIVDLSDN
jgi:lipopolysaccharide/colanic/teichoic acid biosynthesis glycosyltransferase